MRTDENLFPVMDRDSLIKLLHEQDMIITFTKKDGTVREMQCTLAEDIITEDNRPKGEVEVRDNGDTIRVFDIEKDAWRSFNYSTIISVMTL